MKTALVERDRLWHLFELGLHSNQGSLKNAEMLNLFRRSEEFGISHDNLRFDFSKIIQRSRGVADKSEKGVAFLMKKNNVATFMGSAKLAGKGVVEVYDASQKLKETISASRILLATGAWVRVLFGIAFDGKRVISSTEAMILKEVPKSLLIIGAGRHRRGVCLLLQCAGNKSYFGGDDAQDSPSKTRKWLTCWLDLSKERYPDPDRKQSEFAERSR
jgi:dihydrolipoamide dehydrogenase